jgi:hypothetical protein
MYKDAAGMEKQLGRLKVKWHRDFGAHSCVEISCPDGWNDSCPELRLRMSVEEARDLQYAIGRMLRAVEESQ